MLNNVSGQCETEPDFKQNIVPLLPVMCQLLGRNCQSEAERLQCEQITTALVKVSACLSNLSSTVDNFEKLGELHDQLSDCQVHETILNMVQTYCTSLTQEEEDTQQQQQ